MVTELFLVFFSKIEPKIECPLSPGDFRPYLKGHCLNVSLQTVEVCAIFSLLKL